MMSTYTSGSTHALHHHHTSIHTHIHTFTTQPKSRPTDLADVVALRDDPDDLPRRVRHRQRADVVGREPVRFWNEGVGN